MYVEAINTDIKKLEDVKNNVVLKCPVYVEFCVSPVKSI